MERNVFNNARYHRRELLEINPVPISDSDDFLESSVYKALSLTGHWVKANELQACHRLKKMGTFVGCSFRRACVARTMSYLINLDSWKMLARIIPRGIGIILSMLNLIKEVNLQRFIMLLTLKNFCVLTISMILQITLFY